MWSFFEFSGFFCSIAVCLFTPLKENSVEWWGTKEASPSLSKQSSLIHFDVAASQSLPYSSVGAEQNRSINRQRFLCHRYFPAKGGKSRLTETFSFFFINFCVWYLWHFSKRHFSWVKMTETPRQSCTFCLSSFNSTQIQNAPYKTYVLIEAYLDTG